MDDLTAKAQIFGTIFVLANRLQVLGDKFDQNLTIKQWLLIVGILKSGSDIPTISEVASLIGSSRQNIKKMAVILEREGFLKLQKDSDDARVLRISLTRKCQDYFKQREQRELKFFIQLFNGFDTNLIKGFVNGIVKLEENIAEMEKQYSEEE